MKAAPVAFTSGALVVPRRESVPAGEGTVREGFLEVVVFMWELEGQLAFDGQRGRSGYLGEEIGRGGSEEQHGSRKKEK